MVTGSFPRPLTLPTLLNQTLDPAGMAVQLKVELIVVTVGTSRASHVSTPRRHETGAGRPLPSLCRNQRMEFLLLAECQSSGRSGVWEGVGKYSVAAGAGQTPPR